MNGDIELIPVDGHSNLGRDPGSNAILNTDNGSYEAYLKAKERSKQKDQEIESLRNELDDLKNLVGKLIQQQDK